MNYSYISFLGNNIQCGTVFIEYLVQLIILQLLLIYSTVTQVFQIIYYEHESCRIPLISFMLKQIDKPNV